MSDELNIEYWDIKKIKPYKDNNKKHSEAQVDLLQESMNEFGVIQPLVINPKGVIICGEGRYRAFKKRGTEKIPVVVKDLSPEKESALRIADNKIPQFGVDWVMPNIASELNSFKSMPNLIKLTTFKLDDIKYMGGVRDVESFKAFGQRAKAQEPEKKTEAETVGLSDLKAPEPNQVQFKKDDKPKEKKHYLYVEVFGLWDINDLRKLVSEKLKDLGAIVR